MIQLLFVCAIPNPTASRIIANYIQLLLQPVEAGRIGESNCYSLLVTIENCSRHFSPGRGDQAGSGEQLETSGRSGPGYRGGVATAYQCQFRPRRSSRQLGARSQALHSQTGWIGSGARVIDDELQDVSPSRESISNNKGSPAGELGIILQT